MDATWAVLLLRAAAVLRHQAADPLVADVLRVQAAGATHLVVVLRHRFTQHLLLNQHLLPSQHLLLSQLLSKQCQHLWQLLQIRHQCHQHRLLIQVLVL